MNEFEKLYKIRQVLDENIAKNALFKLSVKEAIECVMIKVGMLFPFFQRGDYEKKQEYMKRLIRTNATYIDEILFFQESLKWICRWCMKYCDNNGKQNDVKIKADDVYKLMGVAYAYNEFVKYSFFHSKKVALYREFGNCLQFDYLNEESQQVHQLYDTLIRKMSEKKDLEDIMMKNKNNNDIKIMEIVHRRDFDFTYNFNFGKFTLKDYEEISTALNNYIMRKKKNSHILNPGVAGITKCKRVELVEMLIKESGICKEKVEEVVNFFTYKTDDKNGDLSLNYFFEMDNDEIMLSEGIFSMQRAAVNALRVLAKSHKEQYDKEQNMFEIEQKNRIKKIIKKRYMVANNLSKEQEIRPGMDMLVYDKLNNHLQVIELKYKIPVESEMDTINLDKMLEKAYLQVGWARKYVEEHEEILTEYFGTEYKGIIPDAIDYFVITNYSIGTGVKCQLPTPILLEEHYLQLMQCDDGMRRVSKVISDKNKCIIKTIKKRYARYGLIDFKIKIPEAITNGNYNCLL